MLCQYRSLWSSGVGVGRESCEAAGYCEVHMQAENVEVESWKRSTSLMQCLPAWTPPPRELEFWKTNHCMDHSSGVATHLPWFSMQPGMPGPASYIQAPSNEATGSCRFIKHQWGPIQNSGTPPGWQPTAFIGHQWPVQNSGAPVGWQPAAFIGHQWSPSKTLEPL